MELPDGWRQRVVKESEHYVTVVNPKPYLGQHEAHDFFEALYQQGYRYIMDVGDGEWLLLEKIEGNHAP